MYDGTVVPMVPMVHGFLGLGLCAFVAMQVTEKSKR
jgi:hypothetical protein